MTRTLGPLSQLGVALVLLLGFAVAPVHADAGRPLIVQNLTTSNGLPQGTVMASLQDSQGFVWLGTQDGLVRFDGHDVERYAYSAGTEGSLPGNFVNAIAEDARGDLWIGVKGAGLSRWNRATDSFTVYRHDPANATSLASDAVRAVLVDTEGGIWAGTVDAGLSRLDPVSGTFRHFRHDSARKESLRSDQVQSIIQDRSGRIFIGTQQGLDLWSPATDGFVHYELPLAPDGSAEAHISTLAEDASGSLWVGTFDAGLYQLDSMGRLLAVYRHDGARPGSLVSNDVRAILDDQAGHLWVGTTEGLELLDRTTHEFSHYSHDKTDPASLSDSYVVSLSRDLAGMVWIGLRAGGVSRWNPRSWELGGHRPDWLEGQHVTSFADAGDERIWVGTMGGGLFRFEPKSGAAIDLDTILGRPAALTDSRVMSLNRDRRGTLWIGTMASGLLKLSGQKLTEVPVAPGDPRSLSDAGVMSLYESRAGLLWIGTHAGGVNVLDPATGLIRQLPVGAAPGAVSAPAVTSFAEDRHGNMWIGTENGGLNLARADGTVIKVFRHDPADPASLAWNTVYSLVSDNNGDVWVATDGGGLDRVVGSSSNPAAVTFEHLSRANGTLSSETLYGALPDDAGHLWLSGNAGLIRIATATGAVKTYHTEHGLQGEEFNFGAYFRTADGRLCFGGPGGFNIFDPARLSESDIAPRVALMRLEVLGAPLQTPTPYWQMQDVQLDYRDTIVSFDFAALDFTSPGRNRLAYRMPGLTDRWIDLGTQRRVTLTNLDAGDHVLEVRAANADSKWSETPLRLRVHKKAAPWLSGYAYAAYALVAAFLLLTGLRWQRRKLRAALEAQHRLESQVALRTQELRETNQQLIEASEAKSSFLARMGHELRTPMNGVVGMTELLSRSELTTAQARQTRTIKSSAQALLQILNDLLDLSKIQAGKVQLEAVPFDLTQLLEECTALFAGAAADKGLDLLLCPPAQDHRLVIGDPLRIRQILLNLIGNAVKFTEQGEVVVRCDLIAGAAESAQMTLCVQDTGIGLTAAAIDRIFEPFAQADETTTRRFGGTGLGLSICREIAEIMGGSIKVDSSPNVGSTFRVELPVRQAAEDTAAPDRRFAGVTALVLTRHPAFAESVSRYLSQLDCQVIQRAPDANPVVTHQVDLVIVDEDTCPGESQRHAEASTRAALLVASRRQSVEGLPDPSDVRRRLHKPIHREGLRDALEAAFDHPPSVPATVDGSQASAARIRGRVLVVEDDPVNGAVAEGYLERLGYSSVLVTDGASAVARSATEKFDLILMDLNMPGLDGLAATDLIRQRGIAGARVPIVALTANDAATYRESCLRAGMDDILSKPYRLEECAEMLSRWIVPGHESRRQESYGSAAVSTIANIDLAIVSNLQRLGASTNLYSRLVSLFLESSDQTLADLRQALNRKEFGAVRSLCHKSKSAAANVGAMAFSATLAELEKACVHGDAEQGELLLAKLESAYAELIVNLDTARLRNIA